MSQNTPASSHPIVPREKLDFGLDGDIPRFWFGGDPFRTRFFDALSTLFPVGERFFITCVRDYKDQVTDPKMLEDIRDFTRQEGQHGMVHTKYNDRLAAQGVNVERILKGQEWRLFSVIRKYTKRDFTLGITAAAEHITAIMADCFVERQDIFADADPRIRALYIWHAMEEMEHKAVAFDVFQKVAKASYWTRMRAFLLVSLLFPFHTFKIMSHMLKVDGFTRRQRLGLWAKGLWWLYRPRTGLLSAVAWQYLAYMKPGFHPWQQPLVDSYPTWVAALQHSGDPVLAGNTLAARKG
jgi:predicted metal-dependent hydrolase